jgi:lysosomal Pro-X carboxypeptidase
MPFGSPEESFSNASTLGYFTSTQALADYATLILGLKKNLSAENCPVIVFGGSYGGSKIPVAFLVHDVCSIDCG